MEESKKQQQYQQQDNNLITKNHQKIKYLHALLKHSQQQVVQNKVDLFDDQMIFLESLILFTLEILRQEPDLENKLEFNIQQMIQQYVDNINNIAQQLKNITNEEQLTILSKAVELLACSYCENPKNRINFIHQQINTLNNLSIIYRGMNKLQLAQNCINSVIRLQNSQQQQIQIIGSYLNQSVIFSEANNHQKAIECILQALEKVKYFKNIYQEQNNKQQLQDIIQLEMIGFYNLGAEYEFVKKYSDSLEQYKQAKQLAEQASDNQLIQKIDKAIRQIEQIKNK